MIIFDEKEKIMKVARRHWLAFVVEIILSLFTLIFPFAFTHFSWFVIDANTFLVSYLLWAVVIVLLFFVALSDHYLDVWIITDGRIIDVEQKGVFSHEIHTLRYDLLSDILVEQNGAFPKMFNYGNIRIKRTDGPEIFSLLDVHQPEKIKEIIQSEQKEYLNRLAGVVRQQAQI